jgi:octaprenyl-diphosphate synthase
MVDDHFSAESDIERIPVSQLQEQAVGLKRALEALYAPIRAELDQVEAVLADQIGSRHPQVDEIVRHGIRLGGKRLRPALLLLSGRAIGPVTDEHITLAAVVEMIHLATLIHDDVLDEAEIRRHVDTVNARWNNETSVLLGDFLFTHAFYLASTTGSTYACETIGRATNIVCEGELRQTVASGDLLLSEVDYLTIVSAKTAELCACCAELGARFAHADVRTVNRLSEFGRNLGIAFQITDDLLDLEGNEHETGKSLGTDLAKQKMTLPLIFTRDTLDQTARHNFLEALGSGDRLDESELLGWLESTGAFTYTRRLARRYAERAAASIAGLPDSPAKESLATMSAFVVGRTA